ncbi:MAG TPA: nucleoside hydrolase [Candidatus Methylomirabilis sp.]|nr:nucleoside hydrolase [Candidatus Methylomirabilis sp.]
MTLGARGKPIILDTDPGIGTPGSDVDDGLAIALGLLHPGCDLLGLSIVAGNVPLEEGVPNALRLLEIAGRKEVPVVPGATRPLLKDSRPTRERLDGRRRLSVERFWDLPPFDAPALTPTKARAAEFIADAVRQRPGEITVVAIGPCTNVAAALLLDATVAQSVAEIVVMGGAIHVPGLVTPVVEFNVGYDPESAAVVFASGAPVTLVPLDVTTRTFMTPRDLERIAAGGTRLHDFLARTSHPWLRFAMEMRGLPGFWLHDPLALAYALDPAILTLTPMHVAVTLGGELTAGQLLGYPESARFLVPAPGPVNVKVALDVDEPRFMDLFLGTLTR